MRNSDRHHLISPSHVEEFVVEVPAPYITQMYCPTARVAETVEVEAGTYPLRITTDPDGEVVAVADMDEIVTAVTAWKWRIWPSTTRPYLRRTSPWEWDLADVAEGHTAEADDAGTALATFRSLAREVFLELDGVVMKARTDDDNLDELRDYGWQQISRDEAMSWQPITTHHEETNR